MKLARVNKQHAPAHHPRSNLQPSLTGRSFNAVLADELASRAATLGSAAAPRPATVITPQAVKVAETPAPQSLPAETTTASEAVRQNGAAAPEERATESAPAAQPAVPASVADFDKWFQTIQVGNPGEAGSYAWYPRFSATPEAAAEALRLVQQYEPDARIQPFVYTGQLEGQPVSHAIVLPNGNWLNAGLLLDWYYHQGAGVDTWSDQFLRTTVANLSAKSTPAPIG